MTTTPNTTANGERANGTRTRDQRLSYYHPTATGGGSALQLELKLNRRDGERCGCFFLEMAAQKSAGSRQGGSRTPATFDWENKLTVKLEFSDVCELLAVLEGRQERAGGTRNGLYHETDKACTVIALSRNAEKGGHWVGLSRKDKATGQLTRMQMGLSEPEAVGLRSVFQAGLFFMTFHGQLFCGWGDRVAG